MKDIIDVQGERLREYQFEVLQVAKDFANFCDDNDIFYTLSGGSVLGAIRHNGFIPWDDDIDINMPRKDYDKFLNLFEKKYSDKYYVQTPKKDSSLGLLITQIRKRGTIARRKYDLNSSSEKCGISIDIYIIENIFNNKFLFSVQKLGSLLFPLLVSISRFHKNRNVPNKIEKLENREINYKYLKKILGFIVSVVPINKYISLSFDFFQLCKNSHSRYVSLPTGRRHINGEIFERKDICACKKHKFEDTYFNIPINFDKYLSGLYGDYMQVPENGKREKHMFFELKY